FDAIAGHADVVGRCAPGQVDLGAADGGGGQRPWPGWRLGVGRGGTCHGRIPAQIARRVGCTHAVAVARSAGQARVTVGGTGSGRRGYLREPFTPDCPTPFNSVARYTDVILDAVHVRSI